MAVEAPVYLTTYGANIKTQGNEGKTPLDTAEDRLSDELVARLGRSDSESRATLKSGCNQLDKRLTDT